MTVGLYRVVAAEDGSEELVAVTASDDDEDADGEAVTATIDEDDGWTYTFSGLPAYDEDGEAIEYAVVEVAVDGYETSYSDVTGSVDDGYNVTVTNVHEPEGDDGDGESEGGDDDGEPEGEDEDGEDAGNEVVTETVASSEDVEEDADEAEGSELADTGDWAWTVAAGFAAAGLLAIWASMAMRRRGRNA